MGHSYGADTALDSAVIGEGVLYDANQALSHVLDGNIPAAGKEAFDAFEAAGTGLLNRLGDTAQFVAGSAVNFVATGGGVLDPVVDWGDRDDIYLLEDGVTRVTDAQTVVVFEGDFEGGGHHPNNYAKHVAGTSDEATTEFFESLSDAGYGGRMERWSIDVSVPSGDGG